MTKLLVTQTIVGSLVAAMVAGVLPAACSTKTAINQGKADARVPGLDAPAGSGGAGGSGSDARVAGSGGNPAGGGSESGGAPAAGGSTRIGGNTGAGGGAGGGISSGGTGSAGKICGGFAGANCAASEFCEFQAGLCTADDATGNCAVKPTGACPAIDLPVCGCDGKTYGSDCERRFAGVSKRAEGACATPDAGFCPTGQKLCPSCTPGASSFCAFLCPVGPCLAADAGCAGDACARDSGTNDATAGSCGQVTTQTACDGRSDCHSVLTDPGTCGCAGAGCCAHFSRCAEGGRANCTDSATCKMATPFCELPYVLSYTSNCYEGCVHQSECAGVDAAVTPPTCPQAPPKNASSCGSASLSCFYDICPNTGRTWATCAGGLWTVATGDCGPVACGRSSSGVDTGPCPSGQVCHEMSSGILISNCVGNGCGQGPVALQCLGSLDGNCSLSYNLATGVTVHCNTCPAGQKCAH